MARYMERAENLARILDVHETFSRDTRGAKNWMSIVQLNADEKRFLARYQSATAQNVVNFYVLDVQNPVKGLAAHRIEVVDGEIPVGPVGRAVRLRRRSGARRGRTRPGPAPRAPGSWCRARGW